MVIRDPKQEVEYDPMAGQQGPVRLSSIEATAEVVQDQLKRGKSGRWEIICDEGSSLGEWTSRRRPYSILPWRFYSER